MVREPRATRLHCAPRGIQELYNSARNWAEENDRDDLVVGPIEVLIKAYLDSGGGPVGKSERAPIIKDDNGVLWRVVKRDPTTGDEVLQRVSAEYDSYPRTPTGWRSYKEILARAGISKGSKVPVKLPDSYAGIPMMDPNEKHAFVGDATNPDKCVACGQSLGHDHHWTEAL